MPDATQPLSGLRLLITRPAGQAGDWQRELQQLGVNVRHIPVLSIIAIPADQASRWFAVLGNLQRYDAGIFVSTNAVRHLHKFLADQSVALPAELPCFAVGEATANVARELGFTVYSADTFDSESLLGQPDLQQLQGKRIVIFRGQGGRELITQTLRSRGADVAHAELYQRSCPHENAPALTAALSQWRPHVITATSAASVANLVSMATAGGTSPALLATCLLVPGERVEKTAKASGFATVLTARSMRMSDVSYALAEWWGAVK